MRRHLGNMHRKCLTSDCYHTAATSQYNYFPCWRVVLHLVMLKYQNPKLRIWNSLPVSLYHQTIVKIPVTKLFQKVMAKLSYNAPFVVPDLLLLWWFRVWIKLKTMVCQVGRPASWEYHALGNSYLNFEREHAYIIFASRADWTVPYHAMLWIWYVHMNWWGEENLLESYRTDKFSDIP